MRPSPPLGSTRGQPTPEDVPVYFETAAAIITLILLGRFLEAKARRRTSSAIRGLLELQASTARVVRAGVEVDIAVEDVRVGDVIVIRPGERIPVDGEVVSGESAIDEAALTGESIPVDKAAGGLRSQRNHQHIGKFSIFERKM